MAEHCHRSFPVFLLAGIALTLACVALPAAPLAPVGGVPGNAGINSVSSGLIVLGDAQSPVGSRRDFGAVSTANTPRLEHVFTVRNDGAAALTLVRLQPSCGCTSAVLMGNGRLPVILQPGQTLPIQVRINLEPGLSGPFRKTVSVFAASQTAPAAVLEMVAALNSLTLTATPTILDFGQVSYGKAVSLPFIMYAKYGTVPARLIPSLSSSSSDVTLSLTPAPGEAPGIIFGTATLSAHAHLGSLQGNVLVLATSGSTPLLTLPVQGTVRGDITATPLSLSWNASVVADPEGHRIPLSALTSETLRGLRVSCTSRALSVHLEDAASPTTAALTVTLTSVLKRNLTARIVVTTASGQCLQIPVSVALTSTP